VSRAAVRAPLGRSHSGAWLDAVHAAAVPLLPAAAAAGFVLRLPFPWRGAATGWLLLWLPFALPIVVQVAGPEPARAVALASQVAFAALVSVGARLRVGAVLGGGVVAVVVLAALVVGDRWHSARSWYPVGAGVVTPVGVGAAGGVDRVVGGEGDRAVRTWSLQGSVGALVVDIDARLAESGAIVPPGAPAAAPRIEMRAQWPGGSVTFPMDLTRAWSTQRFLVEDDGLSSAAFVQLVLRVPDGVSVDVRAARLAAASGAGGGARPLPTRPRVSLWFEHFNLLGHVAAMWVAVVLTAAARRGAWTSYGAVLAAGIVTTVATGSRAATLAIVLALACHALAYGFAGLRAGRPGSARLPLRAGLGAAVAVLVALAALALTFAARPIDGFGPPRSSIWRAAVGEVAANPWFGSTERFEVVFASAAADSDAPTVRHAHNMWLDAGYRYGVPGLAAAVLLTLGMTLRAWRSMRWHGLAIIVPFLALQVLDVTFWYPGVLAAVFVGLNSGSAAPSPPRPV
jgi:hypothetical protein